MRYHYKSQLNARQRRHLRVRAKISGTPERPRLNVFRSSAHIYAQLIDDSQGVTLTAASSLDTTLAERVSTNAAAAAQAAVAEEAGSEASDTPAAGNGNGNGPTKVDKARAVGQMVGERALALGITSVVFDRGGFRYHGRVKAVAEGAREAGLNF
jgi:large subunit ribosomal protein L18